MHLNWCRDARISRGSSNTQLKFISDHGPFHQSSYNKQMPIRDSCPLIPNAIYWFLLLSLGSAAAAVWSGWVSMSSSILPVLFLLLIDLEPNSFFLASSLETYELLIMRQTSHWTPQEEERALWRKVPHTKGGAAAAAGD